MTWTVKGDSGFVNGFGNIPVWEFSHCSNHYERHHRPVCRALANFPALLAIDIAMCASHYHLILYFLHHRLSNVTNCLGDRNLN